MGGGGQHKETKQLIAGYGKASSNNFLNCIVHIRLPHTKADGGEDCKNEVKAQHLPAATVSSRFSAHDLPELVRQSFEITRARTRRFTEKSAKKY